MSCDACGGKERRCEATFICKTCHHKRNVCREKVGETRECSACWERRELGPAWTAGWTLAHNTTNRDSRRVEKIVQAAQQYQEGKE